MSLRPDALSLPEASAELLAEPASGPGALDSLADTTLDTGRLPGASTVASTDGPRVVVDEPKHSDSVDVWAPDTMVESEAAADSASRHRAGPSLLATRVELHNPEAATKSAQTADADARFSRLSATPGVRSVLIDQDSARSHDEWSQDTIADASPVPEVSHSIAEQRRVALPRSLLVAHRFTDMTAEDEGESS